MRLFSYTIEINEDELKQVGELMAKHELDNFPALVKLALAKLSEPARGVRAPKVKEDRAEGMSTFDVG